MKTTRRRTVSGKNILVLKREKTARQTCGKCGSVIHGLKNVPSLKSGKLSHSEKSVNRPYGGMFCSGCSREIFKTKARLS